MSQSIEINRRDGGTFDAYLSEPPSGPAPAVVIIPSIMGVTDGLEATADRIASHGFIVAAIDPFSRTCPGPLTPERREEAHQRMADWKLEQGIDDVRSTIDRLKTLKTWNGKWALLGYCFGGRLAFVALSQLGADGAVAFHGVGMHLHLDEAGKISKPFSYHFGAEDPVIPMETVDAIKAALKGKDGEIFVYEGAVHGFAQQEAKSFHPEAGPLSEQRALTMLERLKTPAFA